MDFVFQGFQSDLPVWGFVLLISATTVLSWWSYHTIKAIPATYRYLLILLRSLAFFTLLLLLINPFFKAETLYFEKPALLVILDNSASTSIEKGDYQGTKTYRSLIQTLNLRDSSRVNYIYYLLDRNIRPSPPESLSFSGSETKLFSMYEAINNHQQDVTAALLISDGIFNRGRDPVYESGTLDIPLFTIALGDTTQQKDLTVKNVISNHTGYAETRHPIEVTVINNGFSNQPFEVRLMKGNEILDSRTVTSDSDLSSHTLNFETELKVEGLQQYSVTIPSVSKEWTEANNTQAFSIDVLDEKQHILSLAMEIHPDIRMIRSLLLRDKNTKLIPRTWLGSTRFIEGPLNLNTDSLDLVILHGYPESGVPGSIRREINTLLEEVPSIVFSTPYTSLSTLEQQINISFPVRLSGPAREASVNLSAAVEPGIHPVMELPAIDFQRMPPLSAPIQNLELVGGTVLFTGTYQGNQTNQPLVAVSEIGNMRRSQITGYGWFRAMQNTDKDYRDFAEQLVSNLVSWTATNPDNRLLKVKPAQTAFSGEQPVELNAYLTNESGESESEADLEVSISGKHMQERSYLMNRLGNGQYQLRLNALPEGIYSYSATARKSGRVIDTRQGEFSVSSSNLEYVDTQRNDRLLKQIAQRSGGTFWVYKQADRFWETLADKGLLEPEEKVRNHLFYPYQHAFWFILIVLFLTAEWSIRKYLALP